MMEKKSNANSDEDESDESTKLVEDEEDDTDDEVVLARPKPKEVENELTDEEEETDDDVEEEKADTDDESDETVSIDKLVPNKPFMERTESDLDAESETSSLPKVVKKESVLSDDDDETVVPEGDMGYPQMDMSSSDSSESLSQNSLAEILEAQIKVWYDEIGVRRPKKRDRGDFESILQTDIDISDLKLDDEEMAVINAEIVDMKTLSLDELMYKINSDL